MTDDLLQALQDQRSTPRWGRSRVAFLGHKDDIQAAIEAGYPAKAVWRVLREQQRFEGSYEQFAHYVRVYLRGGKNKPPAGKTPPSPTPSGKGGLPTFTYSAIPDNKDDLV